MAEILDMYHGAELTLSRYFGIKLHTEALQDFLFSGTIIKHRDILRTTLLGFNKDKAILQILDYIKEVNLELLGYDVILETIEEGDVRFVRATAFNLIKAADYVFTSHIRYKCNSGVYEGMVINTLQLNFAEVKEA